jgi:hypothetical protein
VRLTSEFIGTVRQRVEAELESCRTTLGIDAACREALRLVVVSGIGTRRCGLSAERGAAFDQMVTKNRRSGDCSR